MMGKALQKLAYEAHKIMEVMEMPAVGISVQRNMSTRKKGPGEKKMTAFICFI